MEAISGWARHGSGLIKGEDTQCSKSGDNNNTAVFVVDCRAATSSSKLTTTLGTGVPFFSTRPVTLTSPAVSVLVAVGEAPLVGEGPDVPVGGVPVMTSVLGGDGCGGLG
jgi:hypothetical protein